MSRLHRYGPAFILFNGVTIVCFAAGALVAPEGFWGMLGVPRLHLPLARVMAWYLLVFGIGGLAVWRAPAKHAWVVVLLGLEKMAPAVVFPWIAIEEGGHWLLFATGVADGLLAVLLLAYGRWLLKSRPTY